MRRLERRQRTNSYVWIYHVAFKFRGFFHKTPTLYRYWETIIYFKWQNRVRWVVLGLLQDGAFTDLVENLSVNSLKGDLSNATTFNPPLFPLDNTFKGMAMVLSSMIQVPIRTDMYSIGPKIPDRIQNYRSRTRCTVLWIRNDLVRIRILYYKSFRTRIRILPFNQAK